ncbi:MAG: hypothetical protein HRU25_08350 [Psychrobium sp.]|nr:hypothetical protein [Psychrobium sp.]
MVISLVKKIKNKHGLNAFFIVVFSMMIGGCAHQNFMDAGKEHITNERYELAISEFTQALHERPDDLQTQSQLKSAQTQLNRWAVALEARADEARKQQHLGKALLLYGKVVQVTNSRHAITQYKKIYQQLRQQSVIHAKLTKNSMAVSGAQISMVEGIKFNATTKKPLMLDFSSSSPVFEIQQSSSTAITQYIVGTQLLENPQMAKLRHNMIEQREDREHMRHELGKLTSKYHHQQEQKRRLVSRKHHLETQALKSNLPGDQQQQLRQQLTTISSQLSKVQRQISKSSQRIDRQRHRLSDNHHALDEMVSELSHTPAVVEVPVYADYEYQLRHQTNSLSASLFLSVNRVMRTANVQVSSKDTSHGAHPSIGLAADPMQVQSKNQLQPQFEQQLKVMSKRLLTELVDEHRLAFYFRANKEDSINKQLDLLVFHGLVTKSGAIEKAVVKTKDLLRVQYGQQGEFDVNRLLHLAL